MINVYLDDLRPCPLEFVPAKTYEEAVELLKKNEINILSLDHDLGMDENECLRKTGYDLVKFICENNCNIKEIYIHTDNVVGRRNMFETLQGAIRRGFLTDVKVFNHPMK